MVTALLLLSARTVMIPRTLMPSVLCKERQQRQPCPVCGRTTKWRNSRRWQQTHKYPAQKVEEIGRVNKLNHSISVMRKEEREELSRAVGPLQKSPAQCKSNWCPTHYVTFPQNLTQADDKDSSAWPSNQSPVHPRPINHEEPKKGKIHCPAYQMS